MLIEDAYALERRGFKLQVAPMRLTRSQGGVYTWGVEPELAFGIANRTQLDSAADLPAAERAQLQRLLQPSARRRAASARAARRKAAPSSPNGAHTGHP